MENEPDINLQTIYDPYESIKEWYNFEEPADVDWNFNQNDDHILPKEKFLDPRLAPKVIHEGKTPFKKTVPDVGRNDPCPCGSGKKYKNCHF